MFYQRLRVVATLLAVTAAAVAVTGCAKNGSGISPDGVPLVAKGTLTACVSTPYPPFQSKDNQGHIVGFDIDMMNLVARDLQVTLSVIDTPFEGLKSGLDLRIDKCDIATAGLTINDQRRKVMDFSDPYFNNMQALAVRAGDTKVTGADTLTGRRVAVQAGTTGAEYARTLSRQKNFTILEYPDFGLQRQALQTGQVDAAIADLPAWSKFVRENPGEARIVEQFDTGEQYAYAVRKGADPRLLDAVDATLRRARANGDYAAIYDKWLGHPQ